MARLNAYSLKPVDLGRRYVGKQFAQILSLEDEDGDPPDLTGYTAFGIVVDASNATVFDLSPTISQVVDSYTYYVIDKTITSTITAGNYRWKGGVINAAGDEYPLFEGTVDFLVF